MLYQRRLLFLILLLFQPGAIVLAQDTTYFKVQEDSLIRLSEFMWKSRTDSLRLRLNNELLSHFNRVMNEPGSFQYPFDSLQGISRLRSEDGAFRIFTWNIPLQDNSSRYSGFIQFRDGKTIFLDSGKRQLSGQSNAILPLSDWYGAIYYTLISTESRGKTFYTLLGWNANDSYSNMKVIDILSFDPEGTPQFGSPVFKTREGTRNRVVLEYAENGNAALRYDYQAIVVQKGRKLRERKEWMIVMDRLIPMAAGLEGMRKYYVPAGDVYDGFLFLDGFWTFVEEVKVGNPGQK